MRACARGNGSRVGEEWRREWRHDTLAHRGTATGLTGSPALDAVWYGTESAALGLSSQTTAPSLQSMPGIKKPSH